ncbi:MAG: L-histidine N(alpha)-methyltransferase [SAR324 cluster bacterium]|nr:L-histidine N(alpha)-methyltransferase [SAR324 cluster bacterium]
MAVPKFVRQQHHERLVLHETERKDHRQDFLEAVGEGLASLPKQIPPMFFYDERGSELFEQITKTPEYYPTRTEAMILERNAADIIRNAGQELGLVELGSGSSSKTRLLLDVLTERQGRLRYTPIDISPTIVVEHGTKLLDDYPELHVNALICDYHQALQVLSEPQQEPRLFIFLGSSICNFGPKEAAALLREIGVAMGRADRLLLGMDLRKDRAVLEAAYDDAQGVTAAFNLNLLTHINRELGGNFDPSHFRHLAFFNDQESRIEMHLESQQSQLVHIDALQRSFTFLDGETIHTENSYKHDQSSLDALYEKTGLRRVGRWMDERSWFTLDLLSAE